MRKRDEYHSKVTVDTGMARARVPTPLLKVMGARVGNYLTFRLASSGEAIMRLSSSRVKPSASSKKKTTSGKRR